MERIEAVREARLGSKSIPTRALAARPTRFHVENMPSGEYILIPKVSSERREYIPIGLVEPDSLASDLAFIIPDANRYFFGVLTSRIHMAWVRAVCGRLEGRYRYSKGIVYNNFPWPHTDDAQKDSLKHLAGEILEARASHPTSTLADLYDPLTMPENLLSAHQHLDRAVDRLYQRKPFESDVERVALLFKRYEELMSAPAR